MSELFKAFIQRNSLDYGSLAIIRIVFAATYLLCGGMYHFEWLAEFPSFFFQPPDSLASFFTDFPPEAVLHGINILLPAFAVCLLVGYKTPWASLGFGITYIVGFTFVWSVGVINHNLLIATTAIVLAFSGWGQCYSVDAYLNRGKLPAKDRRFLVAYYAMILAFTYFTAGFSKIMGGWLHTSSQAAYMYLIDNYYITGRQSVLAPFFVRIGSAAFWEAGDYLTVLVEILPLLSLFFPRIFRVSLLLVGTFHVLVYLSLNIPFGYFPLLFCIFMVDWEKSPSVQRFRHFLDTRAGAWFRPSKWYVYVALLLVYLVLFYGRGGTHWLEGFPPEIIFSLFGSYAVLVYFFVERLLIRKLR